METFLLVATQVCILFLLIAVGFVLCKKDILTDACRKGMTVVLLDIVTPCVVVSEMQKERTAERMRGLLITACVYAVYLIAAILLSRLLVKTRGKTQGETAARRICMVYTNCGFMGLPLLAALKDILGEDALFYGSVIIAVNNLFIFTQGIRLFGGKPGLKGTLRMMLTPAVIGVVIGAGLFFTGLSLPTVVEKPIDYLGSMNTPLAMLMIGAIICRSNLRSVLTDRRIWFPVFVRNLLFPLLFLGAVAGAARLIPLEAEYGLILTCLVIASCPVAGNCAIFAERYHGDSRLASGIFTVSTLLSAVTVPLLVALASLI